MFLIIPAERRIDWSRPPLLTLSLIFISTFIYFVLQNGEQQKFNAALQYYLQSPLADIEIPAYLKFRGMTNRKPLDKPASTRSSNTPALQDKTGHPTAYLVVEMLRDDLWQHQYLPTLVEPISPDYSAWHESRATFAAMLAKIPSRHYGFKPAEPSIWTSISYQFLHGGLDHLLGNMLFLLIFGFSLERILGARKFIGIYILSGMISAWFFALFNPIMHNPLIGASGSIAGLMGAYASVYGTKRIQFFVWIVAYFRYWQLPALVVLPVWILKEIIEYKTDTAGSIAYIAHVGGLIAGAILAQIAVNVGGHYDRDYLESSDEVQPTPDDVGLEQAMNYMRQLKLQPARRLLAEIIQRQPGNLRALELLFYIQKLQPDDGRLKKLLEHLLQLTQNDRELDQWFFERYREYRALCPKQGFTVAVLLDLAQRFVRAGHIGEAEKIIHMLERSRPDNEHLPELMLNLATYLFKNKQRQKSRDWLLRLENNFQHTVFATHAGQLLDRIDSNKD